VIGEVKGQGNSQKMMQYSFIDAKHAYGVNYYRVNQIDFDGKHQYTRTVASELKKKGKIKIFPNPAQTKVTLHSDISIKKLYGTTVPCKKWGFSILRAKIALSLTFCSTKQASISWV
jgi:hypothetical protein